MDPTAGQLTCRPGDEVVGSDDRKIGKLVAFDANVLTVEHGLLGKGRHFIPTSAVSACGGGKVYLNATKDADGHAGWETPPAVAMAVPATDSASGWLSTTRVTAAAAVARTDPDSG